MPHSTQIASAMQSLPLLLLLSAPLLAWAAPLSNVSFEVLSDDEKAWRAAAVEKLWIERHNMSHTPLLRRELLKIPGAPSVDLYIKDETASESGTLKHRFVWALTMWAVVEGKINSNTTVYDSTSGNTGASEAYMCRLIGVPYVAVVANELEQEKINQITQFGGQIMKVKVAERNYWAERSARENGGFFINQFANADAAEEYHESGDYERESTNVFHEIYRQLKERNVPLPDYFIHSAGTGGTISSVGKYITRYSLPTKVVLSDSEYSLFGDYVLTNKYSNLSAGEAGRPKWVSPGVAGIGYGYNTAPIIYKNSTSLLRTVIDQVVRMPDMASIAAMRSLEALGIDGGASTALNFLVALYKGVMHQMRNESGRLSLVIIMGDPGRFYNSTYLNDTWVDEKLDQFGGMEAIDCWKSVIDTSMVNGTNFLETGVVCDKMRKSV